MKMLIKLKQYFNKSKESAPEPEAQSEVSYTKPTLDTCKLCNSIPEMHSRGSDTFQYWITITCKECDLYLTSHGNINITNHAFHPEDFLRGFNKIINAWNKLNNKLETEK